MSTVDDIKGYSAYELSDLADCHTPNRSISAGAEFLLSVRDCVVERYEQGDINEDTSHQIADEAPDPYTYNRWQEFTDLGGWEEDLDDLVETGATMTMQAGVALYQIAERLAQKIIRMLQEENDDD